jgi:alcohol dehydrogenase
MSGSGERPPAVGHFHYLPMKSVHYGRGAVSELVPEVDGLSTTHRARVMIVTSPSVNADPRLVPHIAGLLGDRLVAVYEGVRPHVPYDCLQAGLDLLIAHRPDVIVAVGAGSVMDAARAIALAAGEGLTDAFGLSAFRASGGQGVAAVFPETRGASVPVIGIPTTLSAAEFANCAAVTSLERGTKDLLIADEITPRAVILDPELAVTTPVDIWLSTGIRALDHAIETVYSPSSGPVTDALALDAISRMPAALRASHAAPDDIDARAEAQVAAWESYFGEMNLTLGLSHAIGHQIGARHGVQHGWTSCAVLPTVMRWLAPATAGKQARIARAFGVDTSDLSDAEAAETAARAVEHLVTDLGLPRRPSDLGVEPAHFEGLADRVMEDLVLAGSPRPVSRADVIGILADAERSRARLPESSSTL